jgi:hypothetical protein
MSEPLDLDLSSIWHHYAILSDVESRFICRLIDEVERLRAELARRDEQIARLWPHYTSTYCIHAHHEACRRTCKICEDPCLCDCHALNTKQPP